MILMIESADWPPLALLTALRQHWIPDQDLDAIMDKYDTDKNGVISLDEFM